MLSPRPKRVALIESNTTGTGEVALARLLEGGHEVRFYTRDRTKYPFLRRPAPGLSVVEVETNDPAAVWEALRSGSTGGWAPQALLTFSTFYVPLAAEAAARLGLPHLRPEAARTCHDKLAARRALARAGLPGPRFELLRSEAEALRFAAGAVFPCVVKPPAGSGSVGVTLCTGGGQLLAAFRAIAAEESNERGQALDGSALVETLLDGPELSVETFTLAPGRTEVVGVTAKHLSEPPYFVEMGHDFPATLPEGERRALEEATRAALDAVGYDFGPAHVELRRTAAGPVVVEINPRLAGGMIPVLVEHAYGVDLLQAVLDAALGESPDLRRKRDGHAAIRFLTSAEEGDLCREPSLAAARTVAGVQAVAFDKSVPRHVRPPRSAHDRLGYVIAAGPERESVQRSVEAALAAIHLDVATAAIIAP